MKNSFPESSENSNLVFEKIKKLGNKGIEYWSARELQIALGYVAWSNFQSAVNRAIKNLDEINGLRTDHFVAGIKMVTLGSDSEREVEDILLSRFACYLITLNADPKNRAVALAKSYFAVQTRRTEIADENNEQIKDPIDAGKRIFLREQLREHNKALASAAKNAGVNTPFEYAIFQDAGYKGLYGGLGNKEIHKLKGLKKTQQIIDHMGTTELAANLFRATQTEEKIRREAIKGKIQANSAHKEIGMKVRKTIEEIGGTMPEKLPAEPSIKKELPKLANKKRL